jgi:UDP-N-acetylmuramate--alanine ligase
MSLLGATRVHFVGIGGAGMSAIAKVLIERGVTVSGSDLKTSRAATVLSAMGASVNIGHDAGLIDGADLVVVSAAIPERNPELARARDEGIKVMGRGEALASLLDGQRSVIVAGTHGKTTTTSMIVSVLHSAGLDPTYLVGGGLNDSGTNARSGADDLAVAESDESDGSFLLLHPSVAVITNIEMDHVDHWGSLDELDRAFDGFMSATDPGGVLVVPARDDLVARAQAVGPRVITFGPDGDIRATGIESASEGTRFVLEGEGSAATVHLHALGEHNVMNALAAAGAAQAVGVALDDIATGLGSFRGVERRFDLQGVEAGVTVVDDYAHHPTEVRATLSAARAGSWDRVLAVFQPHRYSRTSALYEAFGTAFGDADEIVITDVYGAGEDPVPGVSGKLISDAVCATLYGRSVAYLPHRGDVVTYLRSRARSGDLVLTMGAGDVGSIGTELLARLAGSR